VKVLSYIDLREQKCEYLEILEQRNGVTIKRKSKKYNKIRENIISEDTKWKNENYDFSELMEEFNSLNKNQINNNENMNAGINVEQVKIEIDECDF
jgi:hypothetical protein